MMPRRFSPYPRMKGELYMGGGSSDLPAKGFTGGYGCLLRAGDVLVLVWRLWFLNMCLGGFVYV